MVLQQFAWGEGLRREARGYSDSQEEGLPLVRWDTLVFGGGSLIFRRSSHSVNDGLRARPTVPRGPDIAGSSGDEGMVRARARAKLGSSGTLALPPARYRTPAPAIRRRPGPVPPPPHQAHGLDRRFRSTVEDSQTTRATDAPRISTVATYRAYNSSPQTISSNAFLAPSHAGRPIAGRAYLPFRRRRFRRSTIRLSLPPGCRNADLTFANSSVRVYGLARNGTFKSFSPCRAMISAGWADM